MNEHLCTIHEPDGDELVARLLIRAFKRAGDGLWRIGNLAERYVAALERQAEAAEATVDRRFPVRPGRRAGASAAKQSDGSSRRHGAI